jgi:glycosyltransferase involved in cell wall biosynthesis
MAAGRRYPVAIAHDHLAQRGGAERVLLSVIRAFPDAPVFTSVYHPAGTYPELSEVDLRPMALNRVPMLRRHHRLTLLVLPRSFASTTVDAEVVVSSSSGWAHGIGTTGRKVVLCHAPARWLYQRDHYVRGYPVRALALSAAMGYLRRWDARAARSAHRYLAVSSAVRDRIRDAYGIEASVLHVPHTLGTGQLDAMPDTEPGYWLCVNRLLPYKNVDLVVRAFNALRDRRLLVVGAGPEEQRLRAMAGPNVGFASGISDARLRWLYRHAAGLVTASHEDFGLTPLEAGAFGRPVVALRAGGFLDTVVEGVTGILVDTPDVALIRDAVLRVEARTWNSESICRHADGFSEEAFIARLRSVVEEERAILNGLESRAVRPPQTVSDASGRI